MVIPGILAILFRSSAPQCAAAICNTARVESRGWASRLQLLLLVGLGVGEEAVVRALVDLLVLLLRVEAAPPLDLGDNRSGAAETSALLGAHTKYIAESTQTSMSWWRSEKFFVEIAGYVWC